MKYPFLCPECPQWSASSCFTEQPKPFLVQVSTHPLAYFLVCSSHISGLIWNSWVRCSAVNWLTRSTSSFQYHHFPATNNSLEYDIYFPCPHLNYATLQALLNVAYDISIPFLRPFSFVYLYNWFDYELVDSSHGYLIVYQILISSFI